MRQVLLRFLPGSIITLVSAAIGLGFGLRFPERPMIGVLIGAVVGLALSVLFYFLYQRPLYQEQDYRKRLEESYGKLQSDHEGMKQQHRIDLLEAKESLPLDLEWVDENGYFQIPPELMKKSSKGPTSD